MKHNCLYEVFRKGMVVKIPGKTTINGHKRTHGRWFGKLTIVNEEDQEVYVAIYESKEGGI